MRLKTTFFKHSFFTKQQQQQRFYSGGYISSVIQNRSHPFDTYLFKANRDVVKPVITNFGFNPQNSRHIKLFSDIFPLHPTKLAAATIISQLTSHYSTQSAHDLNNKATKIFGELIQSKKIEELEKKAVKDLEDIQKKLRKELAIDCSEDELRNILKKYEFDDDIIDLVASKFKGKGISESEYDSVITVLSYNYVNNREKSAINDLCTELLSHENLTMLETFSRDDAESIYVFGPAGAGKSTAVKIKLENGTLQIDHVMRFTPDDFQSEVINVGGSLENAPSDDKHSFLQTFIFSPIEEHFFGEHHHDTEKAPRIVRELIVPTPERIETFGGKKVEFYLAMHLNINNVIKGAQERAKDQHRTVDVDYIVGGQIAIAKNLPATLNTLLEKPELGTFIINSTTHLHDKNLKKPKAPVALCDEGKLIIFSLEELIKFNAEKELVLNKENNQCTNPINTVDAQVDLFLKDYKNQLSHFVFMDPDIDINNVDDLNDHTYAYIENGEVKITNQAIYDKVKEKSPVITEFFDQLASMQKEYNLLD